MTSFPMHTHSSRMTRILNVFRHSSVTKGRTAAIVAAVFLMLFATGSSAQMIQRIAAIVNDSVISGYDLEQRLGLVFATAGVPRTPENLERIRPQVLRALVDERLQIQEAVEKNIEVDDADIDRAIERLGSRSNMSLDQILEFLESVNVNVETLRTQVFAELAWNELVESRFGPRVTVTDTEIDTVLERIINQSELASYLVSEVLVPVETPEDEARARAAAAQLVDQLRQGGDIRAIAGQFSQAPTAANGGDAGWIIDGQLSSALNSVLRTLNIGQTSDPIRTVSGYHILQLRDRRLSGDKQDPMDAAITLEAINIPFTEDMPRAQLARTSEAIGNALKTPMACGELEAFAKKLNPNSRFNRIEERPMRAFPEPARPGLMQLKVNEWGQPQRTPDGIELVVLCDRKVVERQLPSRDDIENQLFSQELAMMSRRYLRDLRRNAVVEMR